MLYIVFANRQLLHLEKLKICIQFLTDTQFRIAVTVKGCDGCF